MAPSTPCTSTSPVSGWGLGANESGSAEMGFDWMSDGFTPAPLGSAGDSASAAGGGVGVVFFSSPGGDDASGNGGGVVLVPPPPPLVRCAAMVLVYGEDGLECVLTSVKFAPPPVPSADLDAAGGLELRLGSACETDAPGLRLERAEVGGVTVGLADGAGLLWPDPCRLPPVPGGMDDVDAGAAKEEEEEGGCEGRLRVRAVCLLAAFESGAGAAGGEGGEDGVAPTTPPPPVDAASLAANSSARLFFFVSCVAFPVGFTGANATGTGADWVDGFGLIVARLSTEEAAGGGLLNGVPFPEEGAGAAAVGSASGFRSDRGCIFDSVEWGVYDAF